MAHINNADAFVTAYDKNTGKKLAHKVPKSHLKIFKNLSLTPKAKAEDPKPVQPRQVEHKSDKKEG